jgi:hypothetical protein
MLDFSVPFFAVLPVANEVGNVLEVDAVEEVPCELDEEMFIWRKLFWKSSSHDLGSVVCSSLGLVLSGMNERDEEVDEEVDEDDVLDEILDEDSEEELERIGVMINSLD